MRLVRVVIFISYKLIKTVKASSRFKRWATLWANVYRVQQVCVKEQG